MSPCLGKIVKKKLLGALGLDQVRFAGSGSAPIPAPLLTWYNDLGLQLLEGYGMSENFCYSHTTHPGKAKFGFIGQPFPGVTCKLSDAGEILVKSPGMMKGYYKAPEKTAEVVTDDGYLRTGDKGFIDEEGNLKIIGRVKDLFKTSKGKYVAPAPIENIVNNNENVELSIVCGSGRVATCIIVQLAEHIVPKIGDPEVKAKVEAGLLAMLKEVNAEVEEFEKAKLVVVASDPWTIEKGFLTPTMKIKRAQIEGHYETKMTGWYEAGQKVIWE
jgi:long-chain acyl-CoA synthetase